jgi:hypothetical protein
VGWFGALLSPAVVLIVAFSSPDAPASHAQEELTPGWSGTLTVVYTNTTNFVGGCTDRTVSVTQYSVSGTEVNLSWEDESGGSWSQPVDWNSSYSYSRLCEQEDGSQCGTTENGSGSGDTSAPDDPSGLSVGTSYPDSAYELGVSIDPLLHYFETTVVVICEGWSYPSAAFPRSSSWSGRLQLPADRTSLSGEVFEDYSSEGVVDKTWFVWDITRLPCTGTDTDGDTHPDRCDGDDDNDNLQDYYERFDTSTNPLSIDTDGDALLDPWEVDDASIPGAGFDLTGDGVGDLRWSDVYSLFPAPSPRHKDIFLEVDWMDCVAGGCAPGDYHNHFPSLSALEDVRYAFEKAPLSNPDGIPGIDLTLWVADLTEPIPETNALRFDSWGSGPADDFDDLKNGVTGPCDGNFGDETQRGAPNCEDILAVHRKVFRYAIFGHSLIIGDPPQVTTSGGQAEIGGNDMVVTLGGWGADSVRANGGQQALEAGTFMHELGHTLGLHHGGSDDKNCKPNYLSIMSYSLQNPNIVPNRPLDYSRAQLPTLNEASLSEPAGISGPAGRHAVYGTIGDPFPQVAPAAGPIDWNNDGAANDIGTQVDVNRLTGISGCDPNPPQTSDVLTGNNDWASIDFNFHDSLDYGDGVRTLVPEEPLTSENALTIADSVDFDGDGLSNADDNCPAIANSAQTDFDGDTAGDHCDDSDGDSHLPPAYTTCEGTCPGGRFSDHVEATIGTDPALRCPVDTFPNNENVDAWPPDLNDNRTANLSDIVLIGPHYNKVFPNAGYNARMDFNTDNRVNLSDVVLFGPYYNKTCLP